MLQHADMSTDEFGSPIHELMVDARRAAVSKVRVFLLIAFCVVLATPSGAQSDDAAYCARLGHLASRYTGGAGGDGNHAPDLTTIAAILDCNKGNTAKGIAVLEAKLRSNGFTLPKR